MDVKKYELLKCDTKKQAGRTLYRIRALVSVGSFVSVGDLGGYVESEKNLSHEGNAWVSGNARVYGDAWVYGDAQVSGDAWVYGDAWVSGNARVYGYARISGNAWVSGDSHVSGDDCIVWFSNVGSENGTLTVCKSESGLFVSRGCFSGTCSEFMSAVEARHGFDSKIGREYSLLIEVARSRILTDEE